MSTVRLEPGPAMMWNTVYGMHPATGPTRIDPAGARRIATAWLAAHLPGRLVGEPDAYPGYDTMETTTRDGTVNGMLSVNTGTGQVWWHSWHGRFLAREDA